MTQKNNDIQSSKRTALITFYSLVLYSINPEKPATIIYQVVGKVGMYAGYAFSIVFTGLFLFFDLNQKLYYALLLAGLIIIAILSLVYAFIVAIKSQGFYNLISKNSVIESIKQILTAILLLGGEIWFLQVISGIDNFYEQAFDVFLLFLGIPIIYCCFLGMIFALFIVGFLEIGAKIYSKLKTRK